MRVLNTRKPIEPSDEDVELLRRLLTEALDDPDGFIIISTPVTINPDGTIIIHKGRGLGPTTNPIIKKA